MKFEFDNLQEIEQFLMFSAHIGRAFAVAPPAESAPPVTNDHVAPGCEQFREAESIASREERPPLTTNYIPENPHSVGPVSTDKPKRTRRTKAEMEAVREGVADTLERAGETPEAAARLAAEAMTPTDANPFAVASPATQAILDAPNQSAATLAGIAAMQTPPVDEQPAAPRVVESIEHLRTCQSFIQAHGMAKYNESFKDGLNANIAAYTPEQRAQHVAILATLGV